MKPTSKKSNNDKTNFSDLNTGFAIESLVPKTTAVKMPPRTNVPIIDMHYAQLDTLKEVSGI